MCPSLPFLLVQKLPLTQIHTRKTTKHKPGWPEEKMQTCVMGKRPVREQWNILYALLFHRQLFNTCHPGETKERAAASQREVEPTLKIQLLFKRLFLRGVSASPFTNRFFPAHISAQFSRHHLGFSEWFPQIQTPPKQGGSVAASPIDTLVNALWRQFLAPFSPGGLSEHTLFPWIVSIRSVLLGHEKKPFVVLRARYCQKRISSRFFLLMFCRGILDHQASQEQRDPKVMW